MMRTVTAAGVLIAMTVLLGSVSAATGFTKLTNPTITTGRTDTVTWSPDTAYLATGGVTSAPWFNVFSVAGTGSSTTLTKLADPASTPGGPIRDIQWKPTGGYVAMVSSITPFVLLYSVSGTTITKCANPASIPSNAATGISWSPNGEYLSVANQPGPSAPIHVYHVSGCTMTKLADPSTLPGALCTDTAFAPNGGYVAYACNAAPYGFIYQLTGSGASATLTKLSDPATVPDANAITVSWSWDSTTVSFGLTSASTRTQRAWGLSGTTLTDLTFSTSYTSAFDATNWSSGGIVIYTGQGTAGDCTPAPKACRLAYQRSGTSMTLLSSFEACCPAAGSSWAPDPAYVVTAQISGVGTPCGTSENLRLDSQSGGTFTHESTASDPCPQADGPNVAGGTGRQVLWSPNGQLIAITTGSTSPYVNVFNTTTGGVEPPGPPILSSLVTSGPFRCNLAWTTPSEGSSPIIGYDVRRRDEWGGLTTITLGVTNTYIDTHVSTKNTTYNVTARNAFGQGPASNNATCRQPPVPLFGDNGAIYGGNRENLAVALGVPVGATDLLLGVMLLFILAAGGYYATSRIGGGAYAQWGTIAGAITGLFVSTAFNLIPVWVTLFLVVGSIVLWRLFANRGGD